MVSFARVRTKSLLSMLWPLKVQPIKNQTAELGNSKEFIENRREQNRCFLEASKNGGMWFS